LHWIDGFDPVRGSKVAGHRGYFLKGYAVLLNQALLAYGTQFLFKKGYCPIQPPYFMKKEIMAETAQLSDFDDQLYK
jgi:seryl-tRNA synthetase